MVIGGVVLAIVASVIYLLRYRMDRPPVGVVNRSDVYLISVFVIVLPVAYLHLPGWIVGSIFAVLGTALIRLTLVPVVGSRGGTCVALTLGIADVSICLGLGSHSALFDLVNGAALILLMVGATNTWVQGGMRTSNVAMLAAFLVAYDLVATWALPMMVDFYGRVEALPFTPVLRWGSGGNLAAIGLGDILMATLWPLVLTKAHSRRDAVTGAALTLGGLVLIHIGFELGVLDSLVPAMIFIGPAVLLHFLLLRRRRPERTFAEFEHWGGARRTARPHLVGAQHATGTFDASSSAPSR
ncbi:hypothetical protein VV02_13855 [Luteipulveratus mongoliensis]|uniref:Uncharacterized protein n=2 Tax=Luteipulveratus mongoliensis TaxID=571913 RepID=A0A0K1JJE5_9MICO|nr:hypothetical protein VV02_13855 [Luteipulveratus mongoliensis]